MNNQLPYKEGGWTVIFDATLIHNNKQISFKRKLGAMSLGASLLSLSFFFMPVLAAEVNYQSNVQTVQKQPEQTPQLQITETSIEINQFNKDAWLIQKGITESVDWDFSLIIPKLGINSRVIPNVDPTDKDNYLNILKKGVAHARNTSFPNEDGTVYIFGHSTDFPWNVKTYNALFYSIKDLSADDEVIVLYKEKPYVYKVNFKKIIDQDDLQYINSQTKDKLLVLQTCWPPGTSWKRLIVVATQEDSNLTNN